MCDIFYIAHLGVQHEIYPAHFLFDLRCQSGISLIIAYPSIVTLSIQLYTHRVQGCDVVKLKHLI